MTEKQHPELTALIEAFCRDDLTDAKRVRLQAILKEDEGYRQFFIRSIDMHVWLQHGLSRPDGSSPADGWMSAGWESPTEEEPHVGRSSRESSSRSRLSRIGLSGTASAAILIVALLAYRGLRDDAAQVQQLATLTRSVNCQWEDVGVRQTGQRIGPGDLRLRTGLAELTFDNGTTVLLEAPVDLELIGAKHAVLISGSLLAKVPPTAVGFSIETPRAKLIDLGTEFGVSVQRGLETVVQVFDGALIAELNDPSLDSEKSRRVEAGEAIKIETVDQPEIQPLTFSIERFQRTFGPPYAHDGDVLIPYKPSEIASLDVVAAPAEVVVDGDLSDWDLSGEFRSACAEPFASQCYVRGTMMYDSKFLYIGAHIGDPMAMRSVIDPKTDSYFGWKGGSLQVRLSTDPAFGWPLQAKTPLRRQGAPHQQDTSDRIAHLTMWYFAPREQPCLDIGYGMDIRRKHDELSGWRGAFRRAPDGLSYTLEYAIPWKLLGAPTDPPQGGDELGVCWIVNWSDSSGERWKGQLIEIKNPPFFATRGETSLTFAAAETWGKAIYRPTKPAKLE